MKKNIFVITIFIVILYFLVSLMTETESTPAIVKNITKDELTTRLQKNRGSTDTKEGSSKPIPSNAEVNNFENLYPCDIQPSENLWENLPKTSPIYKHKYLVKMLDGYIDKKSLSIKDFDIIEHQLNEHFDKIRYIPHSLKLIDSIKKLKGSPKRRDTIIQTIENFMDAEIFLGFESKIENLLAIASYYYSKSDFKRANDILGQINPNFSNQSIYENLYNNSLSKSKTPNEVAVSLIELSESPSPDFRFLIELKKKNQSKAFQRKLDLISNKLIKKRINSDSHRSLDLSTYMVALKIHSRSKALTKRYGTYEQLSEKVFNKETKKNPFNSKECDDREVIYLCDKYCNK